MKDNLIIFDLDGVLFDSVELMHQYTEARFVHIPREAVIEMHTGHIDFNSIESNKWPKKDETPEAVEERLQKYRKQKMLAPMYPGMKELVKKLADGTTLVVNTSATIVTSLPLLEREGIDEHFDLVATREISPEKSVKFRLIAETFKKELADMLFITDTLYDIREAAIVGIPTIAVTWGVHDRNYFTRESHPHLIAIVDTPEELEKIIDSRK